MLRTEDIVASIRRQMREFEPPVLEADVGTVRQVGDGIAYATGLSNVMASEIVQFANGTYGMALTLEANQVGIIILGEYTDIEEGDEVRDGRVIDVPVVRALGRVVDALGGRWTGAGRSRRPSGTPWNE